MASGGNGAVLRQVHRLFGRGTVAGLGEGQLLERYLAGRDEVAFEALVARHGPMVLGVCRRLLRDPDDIEDAFQATFLVLVKKAGAIRNRELLGPWLHGVAHRVAVRSRGQQSLRRAREATGTGTIPEPAEDPAEPGADELRPVLDEELGRLPDKYRTPILLCYFEGRTHDEAAAQLRWPVGTVRSRLARGRDLLRGRLTRRGLAPSAGLLAAGLPIGETSAAVPIPLLTATVRAASRFAAGRALTAGAVSASVATLTQGVLTTMFLTKLKFAAVGVLFAGIAASSAGLWAARGSIAADGPKDVAVQGTDENTKPIKGDLARLQGTWVVSSTIPPTGVSGGEETWQIQGTNLKTSFDQPDRDGSGGRVSFTRYQIRLDEVWTPNQITMIAMDRSHIRLGIYKLQGDRLEVCLSEPGKPAPQFFDAKEDRPYPVLMVFRRRGEVSTDGEKPPRAESSNERKVASAAPDGPRAEAKPEPGLYNRESLVCLQIARLLLADGKLAEAAEQVNQARRMENLKALFGPGDEMPDKARLADLIEVTKREILARLAGPPRATTEPKTRLKPEEPTQSDGSPASTGEWSVRLRTAQELLRLRKRMFDQGQADLLEVVQAQSDVDLLKAQLDAKREALQDERELLAAQRQAKLAEVARMEAQKAFATKSRDRLKQLKNRGAVGQDVFDEAESAVVEKDAQLEVKRAEFIEVEIRLKQIDRQLARIGQIKPDEKTSAPAASSSTERSVPSPR